MSSRFVSVPFDRRFNLCRKQSKGAPGLAFETWDPRNRSSMEIRLSPLSSRAYPDFLLHCSHRRPPDVVLFKENHTQPTEAATLDRKSGEAEGSAVRPSSQQLFIQATTPTLLTPIVALRYSRTPTCQVRLSKPSHQSLENILCHGRFAHTHLKLHKRGITHWR